MPGMTDEAWHSGFRFSHQEYDETCWVYSELIPFREESYDMQAPLFLTKQPDYTCKPTELSNNPAISCIATYDADTIFYVRSIVNHRLISISMQISPKHSELKAKFASDFEHIISHLKVNTLQSDSASDELQWNDNGVISWWSWNTGKKGNCLYSFPAEWESVATTDCFIGTTAFAEPPEFAQGDISACLFLVDGSNLTYMESLKHSYTCEITLDNRSGYESSLYLDPVNGKELRALLCYFTPQKGETCGVGLIYPAEHETYYSHIYEYAKSKLHFE